MSEMMTMTPNAADVNRAETEYVQVMSQFGVDSAEAYVADQYWHFLRQRFFQRRQTARPAYLH